jgi:hypothetical protein
MNNLAPVRFALPQQLFDTYLAIKNSNLICNKTLNESNIAEFQNKLNTSQPRTDAEFMTQSIIQYMYRKNPTNFCRFLVRSKLSHLILWTESKCIIGHFGLHGIVYVKWNDSSYECSLHRNIMNGISSSTEHPSIQNIYNNIDPTLTNHETVDYSNTQYSGRGRGNTQYSGRGRGNTQYSGRGRGNTQYSGRGRGNTQYSGRGRGRGNNAMNFPDLMQNTNSRDASINDSDIDEIADEISNLEISNESVSYINAITSTD